MHQMKDLSQVAYIQLMVAIRLGDYRLLLSVYYIDEIIMRKAIRHGGGCG